MSGLVAAWAGRVAVALAVAIASGHAAFAQNLLTRADALLRDGKVFQAESLYYNALRVEPRNPAARLALGRFIASRGAYRVGAVLLEEARLFGGDRRVIAQHLAPMYAHLGDYKALATLPASPLTPPERERAEWLADNPVAVTGPDSAIIAFLPGRVGVLGQIGLLIGGDTIRATIDPAITGIVVDTSMARRPGVKTFQSRGPGSSSGATIAVALDVRFGGADGVGRSAVPATVEPLGTPGAARVGLDVLERFAPTFSASARHLVLRKDGRAPAPPAGAEHLPILVTGGGVAVVRNGVHLVASEVGRAMLGPRWTLDLRRREIVAER
jgi:hypothetical protein